MAKAVITKRTVDAARPGACDLFIWDKDIPGFGLKVTPAGGKTYLYQYRLARPGMTARTPAKRYTIGKHGSLTPDQARRRARELAALVAQGIDPRQREIDARAAEDERKERAAAQARLENDLLFEKISDLWLDHYEHEKKRRPSSVGLARLVVNNHLKTSLAGTPLPHIGRAELQSIIDGIPAHQRGIRRAVYAYSSVLFGWALMRGYAQTNPVAGMVKPDAPSARERVLTDSELTGVWKATKRLRDPFGSFFRFLILTGQRRSEVSGMSWPELDRKSATWTIPSSRSKNGVAHIVPLARAVIEELDGLAKRCDRAGIGPFEEGWPTGGYVLTTTGRTPISGITKAKAALDKAVMVECAGHAIVPWRIHDLRRTLATGFQRLGVRFEVTEATLNHTSGAKGGVAGIYQRHDWKQEKRSALDAWASHVQRMVTAQEAAKVVYLRSSRTTST